MIILEKSRDAICTTELERRPRLALKAESESLQQSAPRAKLDCAVLFFRVRTLLATPNWRWQILQVRKLRSGASLPHITLLIVS